MSKSQRTKGAQGEREFCALLSEELGINVQRQLGQARDGGCDTWLQVADKPMAVEIKRHEKASVLSWLRQVRQVEADMHVVAWRPSRESWQVCMPVETFLQLVREAGVRDG